MDLGFKKMKLQRKRNLGLEQIQNKANALEKIGRKAY